ncbi:MAG: hypothetical protein JJU00_15610 [Opitutales bacterium]|nr:hypothetical protein [Opitutales bacterium]
MSGRLQTTFIPVDNTDWAFDAFGRTFAERKPDQTGSRIQRFAYTQLIITGEAPAVPVRSAYYVETRVFRYGNPNFVYGPRSRVYYDRLGREIRSAAETYLGDGNTGWVGTDTLYDAAGRVVAVYEPFPLSAVSTFFDIVFSLKLVS